MTDLIPIAPHDLVAMDEYVGSHPLLIDIVYANADHPRNIFGRAIYRADARLWLHRDMADIVLAAAQICYDRHGLLFELKDGLRPVEAQAAMLDTDIVRAHPQWLEDPRLLSPPGKGGHPRGMAIDIILKTEAGGIVDMGTPFDHLVTDKNDNPAARDYRGLDDHVYKNREKLESAMVEAGDRAGKPILPLPAEWWDFRFFPEYSNQYSPIADMDLPSQQKMMKS